MKAPRQHTDDDVRGVIQCDRLPQDVRLAAVSILPGRIAQHHRARRRGQIFSWPEITTENRRHSERAKEIVANSRGCGALNAFRSRQRDAATLISGKRREDRVEFFPVEIVGVGKVRLRKGLDPLEHSDQS